MDFHFYSTIYVRGHNYIALGQGNHFAGKDVARTQPLGLKRGKQDVASANSNTQLRTYFGAHQWGFKLNIASGQPARHGASVFMSGNYRRIENVLESRQLSNRFVLRSRHHLVRRPLCDWTSVFQHDDSFAKREN